METVWQVRSRFPKSFEPGSGEYSHVEKQLLFGLGLGDQQEVNEFLEPGNEIHDPMLLSGMAQCVERIKEAVRSGEHIVVFGDYDADGVVATVLLVQALESVGGRVSHYIPDRIPEGYGLNLPALDLLKSGGAQLVITVDNGIRSVDEANWCRDNGTDLIITDHHQPGEELPNALAIVNPKKSDDGYPYKSLAGVGVAYKLVKALEADYPQIEADQYLDLLAVGTIADLVPLRGENRSLTALGLSRMAASSNLGLLHLTQVAGVDPARVRSSDVGFRIAPRLNAAGRLESAELAYALLMATEPDLARETSVTLDNLNAQRQRQTERQVSLAYEKLADSERSAAIIILFDPLFHEGIMGLIASRLSKDLYRPCVIATQSEGLIKASARSIDEFHITEALDEIGSLFVKYGGHAAAAGFSAEKGNWAAIEEQLRWAANSALETKTWQPNTWIDSAVEADDLTEKLLNFLDRLEPYGMGNSRPIFSLEGAEVLGAKTVGSGGDHLKMTVRKDGRVFDAIGFRLGDRLSTLSREVDIAFQFERNTFRGVVSPQMNVVDLK